MIKESLNCKTSVQGVNIWTVPLLRYSPPFIRYGECELRWI